MKRFYDHQKRTQETFEMQVKGLVQIKNYIMAEMLIIKQHPTWTNHEIQEYINNLK